MSRSRKKISLKKHSTLMCGDEISVSVRKVPYLPKACTCDVPTTSGGIVFIPDNKVYTHVSKVGDCTYYRVCNVCFCTIRKECHGPPEE